MKNILVTSTICVLLCLGIAKASPDVWFVTQGNGGNYQQDVGHLYSYDPATKTVTDRGALNKGAWGDIAFTPSGTLYGMAWASVSNTALKLYQITPGNASTPATYTAVSNQYSTSGWNALGWTDNGQQKGFLAGGGYSDDNLYLWTNNGSNWWTPTTVNPTAFNTAGDTEAGALGGFGGMYGTASNRNLYSINQTTYGVTFLHTMDHIYYGLGFENGLLYGFSNDQQGYARGSDIYRINTASPYTETFEFDLASAIGINDNVWGATTQPIPAPGAVLLGGIGVGLVGWLRRRRIL